MRYRVLWLLANILMVLQMRLTVMHQERVPRTGALLLVSNHLGLTDPIAIALRLRRPVRILSKAEVFEWPIIGWLAHQAGVIAIRRGTSDRDAMRTLVRLLERQQCVLVFPEGTYHYPPEPSSMLPIKTGAAWLALQSKSTIVPVAIWGNEYVWSPARGWRVWQRPSVHVQFGEPYTLLQPSDRPNKAALNGIAEDMALRIAALLPVAYRGVYASSSDVRVSKIEAS